MKIDKEKIKQMAALSDEALWAEIRSVASQHGFTLPEKAPPHGELEKVRSAMTAEKLNLTTALRIINGYRRGKTDG